jgi:hypothetical protein
MVQGSIKYLVPRCLSEQQCVAIGLSSHIIATLIFGFSPVVRSAFRCNHTGTRKLLTFGSFLMLSSGLDAVIRNPLYDGWRAQEPRNAVYLDIFGSREVEGDAAGLLAKSARPLVGEYLCGRQTDEISPGA